MNTPKKPNRPQSDDELFDPRAFDDEAADIDVPVYRREASEKKTSEVAGEAARGTTRGPQDKSEREERGSLAERLRKRRKGEREVDEPQGSARPQRTPRDGAQSTAERRGEQSTAERRGEQSTAERRGRGAARPERPAAGAAGNSSAAKAGADKNAAAQASAAKAGADKNSAAQASAAKASAAKAGADKDSGSTKSTRPLPAASGASSDDAGSKEGQRKKRDIYEVLGRARPQRIQAAPPVRENRDSRAAGTAADARGAAGAAGAAGVAGAAGAAAAASSPSAPVAGQAASARTQPNGADPAFDPTAGSAAPGSRTTTAPGSAAANAATAGGATTGAAAAANAQPGAPTSTSGAQPAMADGTRGPAAAPAATAANRPGGQAVAENASAEQVQEQGQSKGEDTQDGTREQPKRGTLSFGLLLLRLVVGGLLLVRGLQTLFAFGGDPGLDALQQQWSDYNGAQILAVAVPAAEVIAGGLLILGLVTPFAAALAAIVAGFLTLNELNTFQGSLWPYGLSPYTQLWALIGAAAMSIIFSGPGSISMDRNRAWNTRPLISAWIFAIVAVAAAVVLWLAVGGGNPLN